MPLGWMGDVVAQNAGSELAGLTRLLQVSTIGIFAAGVAALRMRLHGDAEPREERISNDAI